MFDSFEMNPDKYVFLAAIWLWFLVSPQFPTLLNGPIPVALPNVDSPSLLLSASSHKSWWPPKVRPRPGPGLGHVLISPYEVARKKPGLTRRPFRHESLPFLIGRKGNRYSTRNISAVVGFFYLLCTTVLHFHLFKRWKSQSKCFTRYYLILFKTTPKVCPWHSAGPFQCAGSSANRETRGNSPWLPSLVTFKH